jgi:hypothetical protein
MISTEISSLAAHNTPRVAPGTPVACRDYPSLPISRAIYFNLPPQAIIHRGGLLDFLFNMLKYPRTPCYTHDSLRGHTNQLAAQLPQSLT